MKRRVIKQGNGTLTVTLPKQWTVDVGLKGGDELEFIEKNKSLIIELEKRKQEEKTISIDVSGLNRTTFQILLQIIYRYGYDVIIITTKTRKIHYHRIGIDVSTSSVVYETVNRLIGFEVISGSAHRWVIKRIAEESYTEFPAMLRRIFILVKEMMDAFITAAEKMDELTLKNIEFKHINLKKFINYCLRLLKKYDYEDHYKSYFYFLMISFLSKTEDIIKNNSRCLLKYDIKLKNKLAVELLRDIQHSYDNYYELFYNYDDKKSDQLNMDRDLFRDKLFKNRHKLSDDEIIIIAGVSQILELILDMIENRMVVEKK